MSKAVLIWVPSISHTSEPDSSPVFMLKAPPFMPGPGGSEGRGLGRQGWGVLEQDEAHLPIIPPVTLYSGHFY